MASFNNISLRTFLCLFTIVCCINSFLKATDSDTSNNQWNRPEQVTVVASKTIHSHSLYRVMLILANSSQPATFDLKLIGQETLNKTVLVNPNQSQTVAFSINEWSPVTSVLSVHVTALDNSWYFAQQKQLISSKPKSLSIFIQTDKPIYKLAQKVQFRALFLTPPSLKPALIDKEIIVQVSDTQGNLIKQWQNPPVTQGLVSFELPLSEDPILGDWSIKVAVAGLEVTKEFTVGESPTATFDVQLSLPSQASFDPACDTTNIAATVRSSYTYGKPVRGLVALSIQLVEDNQKVNYASVCSDTAVTFNEFKLYQTLVDGVAEFAVPFEKPRLLMSEEFLEENFGCQFEFVASVEEEQTGRRYNMSQRIIIHATDTKIEWLINNSDKMPPFKPGLNYTTMLKLVHQDGSPVALEVDGLPPTVLLDYVIHDKIVDSVELRPVATGLIEHIWEVPSLVEHPTSGDLVIPQSMNIRATYRRLRIAKHLPRSCSASNQSVQISIIAHSKLSSKRKKRNCFMQQVSAGVSDELRVRIDSTQPISSLMSCHGTSRGDIVWSYSRDAVNKTSLEFDIRISSNMTPELELVCFYTNPENREIIADSLRLPISGLSSNFVTVRLSQNEAQPGQLIDVEVQTKPESIIGLLATDQSVEHLKSNNQLTREQVEGALVDKPQSNILSHDLYHSTAESIFDISGAIVITTNMIQPESAYQQSSIANSKSFDASSDEMDEMNMIPATSSLDENDEMIAEESGIIETVALKQEEVTLEKPLLRQVFPETWIWTNGTADLKGQFKLSTRVPDTLTSYSLSAFSASDVYGIGLSNQPTKLKMFKQFLVKIHAPHSIIKGETAIILATLINNSEQPIKAKIVLHNQYGEFDFVKSASKLRDEIYLHAEQQRRTISVASLSSKTSSFLITPNKLGHIDIKVSAMTDSAVESVLHKIQVKPEGKTQHKNQAIFINLKGNQKGKLVKNFTINIPPNAVEDSEKISVSITGDVLGLSLKNVKNLLRMPYGCGEQNMINLVPNIVILDYLEASGRNNPTIRDLAISNTEKGYQRQLKYKRTDGSFSPFGELDATGSVWLTAYVLKSLQQARSLITVDERILEGAVKYLESSYNEDGSIREVGMIHNRALNSHNGSSTYLTSYCTIALILRQRHHSQTDTNEIQSHLEETIERSLNYLESQLENVSATGNNYELSILSYALHLANRTRAMDKAYEQLWKRAIKSEGLIWWEFSKDTSTDPKRATMKEPNPLYIEITAYALMTLVKRGELELATPIARWLITNQNSNGGFVSTQDTVLAIEALSSFMGVIASTTGPQNMSVKLIYLRNSFYGPYLSMEQYEIGPKSALILQKSQLPKDTKWVQVDVIGSGTGTVQVSWQYSLLDANIEKPAFHLTKTMYTESDHNILNLEICTSYKLGEASNMAVLDVKLPSGYILDVESMTKLQGVNLVKKVEFFAHNSRVEVYFDKLTRTKTCVPVFAFRNWKVSNNKAGSIGVYDYYNRKNVARITYGSKLSSSCDICEADTCSKRCRRWNKTIN